MKVYFSASMTHRERLGNSYRLIMEAVEKLGHELITSFDVLNIPVETSRNQALKARMRFYRDWRRSMSECEVAVIEVSHPSTVNIGLEVGQLIDRGKPTICLHRPKMDPAVVGEEYSKRILKFEYTNANVKEVLKYGFEEAEKMLNRRFTFFISSEIDAYLEKVAQNSGVSRSEFIRDLILAHRKTG